MQTKNLNAANVLSLSRLVFLPLLFVFVYLDLLTAFLIGYIILGSTDMFDGIVARRFNMKTELGKKLDSLSDLFFYLASAWFLFTLYRPIIVSTPNAQLIIVFLSLFALSFVVSGIFCKKPLMMHTIILKLNAVLLYLLVIASSFFDTTYFVTILAVLYIIGVIESIVIYARYKMDVDPDFKSIFHVMREHADNVENVMVDSDDMGMSA